MSTICKTMKAAIRMGGYAVRLFRGHKQIGILAGINDREQAIDWQAHGDYFGADEAQLVDNHGKPPTLAPQSMRRS